MQMQEAFARVMRRFRGLRGEQAGPWLLAIVRNTAYGWLGKNRNAQMEPYDPEIHDDTDRPRRPNRSLLWSRIEPSSGPAGR
jgi:RNA polymerase sigma-70 factor, ECF subfamily